MSTVAQPHAPRRPASSIAAVISVIGEGYSRPVIEGTTSEVLDTFGLGVQAAHLAPALDWIDTITTQPAQALRFRPGPMLIRSRRERVRAARHDRVRAAWRLPRARRRPAAAPRRAASR